MLALLNFAIVILSLLKLVKMISFLPSHIFFSVYHDVHIMILTLFQLKLELSSFVNTVDPDKQASYKTIWSVSIVFSLWLKCIRISGMM